MHDPAAPDRLVRGREIALLTNPTSGRGRGGRHRDAALARLRESGLVVRNPRGRDADRVVVPRRRTIDLGRSGDRWFVTVLAAGLDAIVNETIELEGPLPGALEVFA